MQTLFTSASLPPGRSVRRQYFWRAGSAQAGGLQMIALQEGSGQRLLYPAFDGNGNVVSLVDAHDGSAVAYYEYGPYGELLRESGQFAGANTLRAGTQLYDKETGLYCYLYRYYSPETGRWLSRDPIREAGGRNLYAFVANDPVNRVDLWGLCGSDGGSEVAMLAEKFYQSAMDKARGSRAEEAMVNDWKRSGTFELMAKVSIATDGFKNPALVTNHDGSAQIAILNGRTYDVSGQFSLAGGGSWADFNGGQLGFGHDGNMYAVDGSANRTNEVLLSGRSTGQEQRINSTTQDRPRQLAENNRMAHGGEGSDRGWFGRQWDRVTGAGKWVYSKSTGWHFEGRVARNGTHPTYDQVRTQGSGWQLLGPSQSIYHDNGVGQPELKYIHPSGREAVFDGDTLQPVTDPRYAGTYNYVSPAQAPENWYNVGGWFDFSMRGAGHLVTDVVPYWLGGNVRGNDPPPDPKP